MEMLRMMIAFVKDYFKYKDEVKKQDKWISKFAEKKNYDVNPSMMISTNLKIWLSEMEGIYGKRVCPCFDPSGNKELDKTMICPCPYIEDEIEEYGTCHCALFGKKDLSSKNWKKSGNRLMSEYRIPLNLKGDTLDTRGMPLDSRRGLPIPDTSHQLKSTLVNYKGDKLKIIVATEQEKINLKKIADFKSFTFASDVFEEEGYIVTLGLKQ